MASPSSFFNIFKETQPEEPRQKEAVLVAPDLEPDLQVSIRETMKQFGAHDEELRVRCEKIVELTRIVQLLPKELSSVFLTFNSVAANMSAQRRLLDEALSGLDLTKTALSLRETEILYVRDALSKSEENAASLGQKLTIVQERATKFEKRIEELQDTITERGLLIRSKDYQLENLQTEFDTASFELASVREKLKDLEKVFMEGNNERILLREELAHQSNEREQLAKSYEALTVDANQSRRDALAFSSEIDELRGKYSKLDAEAQLVFADSRALRDALLNAENLQAQTVHSYDSKLGAMSSRLRVSEELLTQSRTEARKLSEDQLANYKRIRELEDLPAKLADATRNLDQNTKWLKDSEGENERLMAKAAELAEKLQSKDRLNTQAAERINTLQETVSRLHKDRDRREAELKKEIETRDEALAKERTERAYTEGVLETARRDRAQLHQTIVALRARATNTATASTPTSLIEYLDDLDDLKTMLRDSDPDVVSLRSPKNPK
jgi:chromosome segregation ATPase